MRKPYTIEQLKNSNAIKALAVSEDLSSAVLETSEYKDFLEKVGEKIAQHPKFKNSTKEKQAIICIDILDQHQTKTSELVRKYTDYLVREDFIRNRLGLPEFCYSPSTNKSIREAVEKEFSRESVLEAADSIKEILGENLGKQFVRDVYKIVESHLDKKLGIESPHR